MISTLGRSTKRGCYALCTSPTIGSIVNHVVEEIEDLGESERDAVRSQIRRIAEHLLKLARSPAEQPRFDARQRAALGLRRYGERDAAERLPAACPYSWDEICRQEWYPVSPEP